MAARARFGERAPLGYDPVCWSLVSGIVITGDADADAARRTIESALNGFMLREGNRGYAVGVDHLYCHYCETRGRRVSEGIISGISSYHCHSTSVAVLPTLQDVRHAFTPVLTRRESTNLQLLQINLIPKNLNTKHAKRKWPSITNLSRRSFHVVENVNLKTKVDDQR